MDGRQGDGGFVAAKAVFSVSGPDTLQVLHGYGFKPTAVIAWWSCQPSHGIVRGNRGGIGYWAENDNVSVAWASADGEASARTRRIADTAAILGLDARGTAVAMRAAVESFDPDGVTLRWDVQPSEPWMVHVLVLGGDSLESAHAGWGMSQPAAARIDLGLPNLAPDLLFLMQAPAELGFPENDLVIGIGAAADGGQAAASYAYPHSAPPGFVTGVQQDGAAVVEARSLRDPVLRGVVERRSGRGPSVRWSPAAEHARRVGYLAIDGIRAKVGTSAAPTTPGRSRHRVGFRPQALLLFSRGTSRSPTAANIGRLCLGGVSSGSSGCTCWDDCDVEAFETMSHVRSFDGHALVIADTQSDEAHAAAKLASIDADGFTLDWITADGKMREFAYVVLGPRDHTAGRSRGLLSRLAGFVRRG